MQDCIGATYTATQSTLDKSARLHRQLNQYWDYLSQKSIIHQIVSAKVQDCIGVNYTATQSTLELAR